MDNENVFDKVKYRELMHRIRNGISLENEDLVFIKTLSKEQLIEIIEINNYYIILCNNSIYNE